MALTFTTELTDRPTSPERLAEILAAPGFGKVFTDHMVSVSWSVESGWQDARITPYGPLLVDPATHIFHYGQSIFEGFKAYAQPDGSIATFRPEANAKRFQESARRPAST